MPNANLRALIVDDDVLIRQLMARALCREGFSCDLAADGCEAQRKLAHGEYDLVVTDLCMPNRHGHALASELAAREDRPLIVVLTALSDPRMTKDLLARGVDDVMFKPVDAGSFAVKLRVLVERRKSAPREDVVASPPQEAAPKKLAGGATASASTDPRAPIEFEAELAKVANILPLSNNILAVSELAQSSDCDAQGLAAAIQADAALAVEILRLANSPYYNPGSKTVVELAEAIPRIGYRRIGELALSMHAFRLLNLRNLPWIDRRLTWRRSVAAGLATDLLIAEGKHASIQNGLYFCATMHAFGRVTLGLLFPKQYDSLLSTCRERGETLQEHEARAFPMNHAAAMARVLQSWSVPQEIYQPLAHLLDEFASVAGLPEPLRTKVELVKLAVLLGWIAAGQWEAWDSIDLPSQLVFDRLRISDPVALIQDLRYGLTLLSDTAKLDSVSPPNGNASSSDAPLEIFYRKLSDEPHDLLAEVIECQGFAVSDAPAEESLPSDSVLVNCLGATAEQIEAFCKSAAAQSSILIGRRRQFDERSSAERTVALPSSVDALRAACTSTGATTAV